MTRLERILISSLSTLAVVLLTACQSSPSTVQTDKNLAQNLTGDLLTIAQWETNIDPFGSSYYADNGFLNNNHLKITLNQAGRTSYDNWPYAELVCSLPSAPEGLKSMTLTYRSTQPLDIKLMQEDFGFEGNKTYTFYTAKLMASPSFRTTTIDINQFTLPSWAPRKSKKIALNLQNVSAINIEPNIQNDRGAKTDIEIKSFLLH